MNTEWSGNRWWRILGVGVAALAALAILATLAGIIASSSQGGPGRTSPINDEYTRMMAELDQRAVSSSANKLTVPPASPHSATLNRPVVSAPEPKPVAAVKITTLQNDPGASPAPMIEPILFPALTPAEISEAAAQTPGPPLETVKPPVIVAAGTSPVPAPMADPVIPPANEVSPGAAEIALPLPAPPVVTMETAPAAPPLVEEGTGNSIPAGQQPARFTSMLPREAPEPASSAEKQLPDATKAPQDAVEDCSKVWSGNRADLVAIRKKADLKPAGFSIAFRGVTNPYPMMSTLCMPGETVEVKVNAPRDIGNYEVRAEGGTATPKRGEKYVWSWVVPETPGVYCLQITNRDTGGMMCLHGLVCVPYKGEERLEGYNVGQYQRTPLNNNLRYAMPLGLFKVTKGMEETWLAPHFQLKQFMCKQQSGYPKFVLVETRLLLKLEALVEGLEERGIKEDSVFVASGYRTPAYNKALGNTTIYSRHLYGDAADIFVDQDRSAGMDDLNKDGKVDAQDTAWLMRLVADISLKLPSTYEGGLGLYPFRGPSTAFIHMDTRGESTRWGFPQAVNSPRPPFTRHACEDGGKCNHLPSDIAGLLVGVMASD